jgi:hypothetical protein
MRKYPIVEIEDMQEPFCGVRRKNLVPLIDGDPVVASEWLYAKNAGWGPEHVSRASGVRCWWECPFCLREYKAQICNRTSGQRSACPYCASKRVCSDNALSELFPEVAAEWHPKKNGKLKPSDVMHASSKRAWWLCKTCKHEWNTVIADRTGLQAGCPACYEARMQYAREHPKPYFREQIVLSEKKKISRAWYEKPSSEDFVSIVESNLKIACQWHPTKNGDWTAFDFSKGSDAIAWWKCKKGPDHEWQAPIYSRTGRKSGCPFCHGKRVSITNSLKSKFPKLAKEWHPKRNGKLRPEDVTYGSSQKVWWRCKRHPEHEWETTVSLRAGGRGCPYCCHQKVSEENSLQSQFPYIAAQLHPTKNKGLKGDEIAVSSSKKVWWICRKGPDHEWQATPANRTVRGSNCPFCSGRQMSVTNSLAALYPAIAKQWDKKKNGKLTPADVAATSKLSVFWRCEDGHSWQQAVRKRVNSTVHCWECLGKNPPGRPAEASAAKVLAKLKAVVRESKGPKRSRERQPTGKKR